MSLMKRMMMLMAKKTLKKRNRQIEIFKMKMIKIILIVPKKL